MGTHADDMRKKFRKWCAIFLLAISLFCSCKIDQSLVDVTKPYLGEYECIRAEFDKRDCLQSFKFIRLTLQSDGRFTLAYQEKEKGEKMEMGGQYIYDKSQNELVFTLEYPQALQKRCSIENGKITILVPIADKTFIAEFGRN